MLPLLLSALLLSLPLNAQTANQTSADPVKAQLVRQQLTANIPPGNSLSPSRYAALFPGFIETSNDTGFSCKVFTTPVPGVSYADDRISTNSPRWTCPAGYFCLSPGFDDMIKCTPGFYCPENTAQPNYCCSRFACSEDATTAVLCPENHYCPTGTVTPIRCNFLANCPKGSKQATKIGIAAVFFAFAIMVWFGFAIKTKSERRRNAKYSILAKALQSDRAQTSNRDATSLGPVEHKFNIRFEDLGLVLPNGVEVMRSVTGQLSAGRSCAVMGPSGAGKTTFINLLTGKVKRTSGRVFINGKAEELKKYKKLIGFVPQEDIMIRELTVREILLHSAKMRLPTHWPSSKKTKKVLETIDYLGMGHVMDSVIGDAEQRGISGGQRKRVNIGMELVAAPSVLFLDEPTSGLDSSTSYEVCLLLRSIAHEQSLTVAAVIHSPSQQAFRQFDDLLLLGKGGRVCFFGPMDNAINYFSNIGFPCPSSENPADYLMDVVSGKVQSQLDSTFKASDLFHLWEYHGRTNAQDRSLEKGMGSSSTINLMHPIDLEEARPMPFHDGVGDIFWRVMLSTLDIFRDIGLWIVDVIWELLVTIKNCLLFFFKDPVRSTPNVFVVFWLCYRRACLQIYRSRGAFFSDQLLHLFCGAFISVAAREMDYLGEQPPEICQISPVALQQSCTSPTDHVREIGIFLCLGVGFAGISVGAVTFGTEKVIYWRDSAAGMSTIPFFLAKFMADIPRIVLAGFMFSLSLILFFPYRSDFSTIYTLVTLLYFVFFSMGYLLSAVVRRDAIGLVGTGFALAWSLVFSGVTPALTDVYDPTSTVYAPISWLWNISAPRHAIEALYVQEVAARPFREAQAKEFGYTYEFDRYGPALIMMCYIGIGWLVAGFLGLKLTNRDRMK